MKEKKTATSVNERIAKSRKCKKRNQFQSVMLSVASIALFILVWEMLVVFRIVPSHYLAKPEEILRLFAVKLTDPNPDGAVLGRNILSSLQVSAIGFVLAVCIGVPLGWLMGWYRTIGSIVTPIFEIIRPIPPVAWIPLMIVWVGVGLKAKVIIIFLSALIPCVINAGMGMKQTSQVLINVGKTCGASNFVLFYKVGIPSALTMTFTGVKVAIGNAWATLVAAEMLAASSGLGYMILQGRNFGRTDIIMLGVVLIGGIGTIIISLFSHVEGLLFGWKKR